MKNRMIRKDRNSKQKNCQNNKKHRTQRLLYPMFFQKIENENSAYFDGDWAWCVNPFSVDDPRLRNGDKTMSFALSTYLNSSFDYVFFSSVVVVDKTIREAILKDITAKDYSIIGITLTCSEETLRERHKKRGDENECSFFGYI